MLTAIIALVTGQFKNVIFYGIIITLALTLGFGYVKFKEYDAVRQATLEFNNKQLQEVIKHDKDMAQKNLDLQAKVDELTKETDKLNQTIQDNTDATGTWILGQKSDGSPPLDPFFNDLLNEMRKGKSK